MGVLSFLPLMSDCVKFEAYLKRICGDRLFQSRCQNYVPTDLLDRQRQKHSQLIEQPDSFAEFAAFELNLNVQTVRKDSPTQDSEKESEPEKAEKIERLPVLEGIRKYADGHVLLVGRPGSGKSTALERLLLQEAEIAQENPQAPIPVLLKLRDLRSTVIDLVQRNLENWGLWLEQAAILELLKTGRFLLLWDGVNELPNDDALKELTELRQRYHHTPMIFTTRTLSVGSDLGIEKKLEMQPLSEPQMRQFTCTYLGNEKGSRLIGQLGQRLREFGETPLLLWMLCGVYSKAGQVPPNLGSVFRLFAGIYDDKKEFDGKVRLWQSRFLQALAFAMMPQGNLKGLRLSMLKSEAVDLFVQLLEKETDPLTRAIGYLDDLLRHHLLQPKNHSEIEFRHQLFQEYFAAEYLLRQLDKLDDLTLKKLYLNPLDWTESLALMLGICDNEQQALRVVRLALEVDLKLGARLAGEVKPQFQKQTVGWVIGLDVPEWLKVELLERTRSEVAVSRLAQALNHKDSDVQYRAAEALGQISTEQAVAALIQALNHEDFFVRESAARALGKVGSEQAVAAQIQALNHKASSVRWSAAEALGKVGLEQAVAAQIQALNHKDSFVRRRAAVALGQIGSKQAVAALIQALNDEDSSFRYRAAKALEKIATPQPLAQLWQLCRAGNKEAFSPISAIQERYRFYNYEIEQMALPTGSPTGATSVTNIIISGGNFGDVVAGDKTIEIKRDYVENQENRGNLPLDQIETA